MKRPETMNLNKMKSKERIKFIEVIDKFMLTTQHTGKNIRFKTKSGSIVVFSSEYYNIEFSDKSATDHTGYCVTRKQ